MSINLNRVTVTGYLAHEPALQNLPAGQQLCELRIGCNHRRQNKLTGRWEEWADFFNARIVGGIAPIAHHRLQTGHAVAIDGRLSTQRSSCEDPTHRWDVVILVDEIQFLTKATDAQPVGLGQGVMPPGEVLLSDEDALDATNAEKVSSIDGERPTSVDAPPASVQSMLLLED